MELIELLKYIGVIAVVIAMVVPFLVLAVLVYLSVVRLLFRFAFPNGLFRKKDEQDVS